MGARSKETGTPHHQYRGRCEALDEEDLDEGDVMHVEKEEDEWDEIKITIDCGAVDTA